MVGKVLLQKYKMKLLIITQTVDKNDPILGFFHRWIGEFAKNFEKVTVICLEMGEHHLPKNVKVLSLGKEAGRSKFQYLFKFYKYILQERKNYDAVFVHMNQEYVLLGWKFWKLWDKKIFLWRNHAKGNLFTRLAVLLSDKVFCFDRKIIVAISFLLRIVGFYNCINNCRMATFTIIIFKIIHLNTFVFRPFLLKSKINRMF